MTNREKLAEAIDQVKGREIYPTDKQHIQVIYKAARAYLDILPELEKAKEFFAERKSRDEYKIPFELFTKPTCRGSYEMGNACGKCEKCVYVRRNPIPHYPSDLEGVEILESLVLTIEEKVKL